jgi:hypothetical protein
MLFAIHADDGTQALRPTMLVGKRCNLKNYVCLLFLCTESIKIILLVFPFVYFKLEEKDNLTSKLYFLKLWAPF